MAASMNRVMLLGNLTRDPEVRYGADGSKIVSLSLATSEQWRDKNTGERKERAEFHRVVIFNDRLAGVAEQYLKKGRKAYLEGQLQTRKWTDQSGQDRYVTEVVLSRFKGELLLLDRAGDGEGGASNHGGDAWSSEAGANVAETESLKKAAGAENLSESSQKGSAKNEKDEDPLADFDDDIPF